MKFKIILFFLFISLYASAQKDLSVSQFFDGKFNKSEKAIVTLLKGKKLTLYNLSVFHSITINDSPAIVQQFTDAVLSDKEMANQVEIVYAGDRVLACYLQLAPVSDDAGQNRFILFRSPNKDSATLIYMEGETDLDELIKLFITKKK
ncbi:MAG: DUF6108 family protein [Bacteroidales bacterium]